MKILRLLFPLVALAGTSHAAIIYSGLKNIIIPTTFVGVTIDVEGMDTVAEEGPSWDVNFFFNGEGIASGPYFHPVAATIALDAPVLALTAGQSVDASGIFATPYDPAGGLFYGVPVTLPDGYSSSATHVGNGIGQFASGGEGYIGFKFKTGAGGTPYFGWMRVELSNSAAAGIVRDWAYENTGSAINVGAVPEPSTVTLLSALASGFAFRRRRK